ncbi:TMEM165/GDT1 family protein [Selenomonas sp. TAMA-11512]|nr:TMEM165/GDT1 family protein [Selenomonas sp. TAMA-11512]
MLAEMGDKTQLIAMAFAARFLWKTVMVGIFVGSLANHLVAVLGGTYLAAMVSPEYIRLAGAFAFIGFGIWTLLDLEEAEEQGNSRYGPFGTVAITFFLGEMGDKTQLAAFTMAAEFPEAFGFIIAGTVTAMLIADGAAIALGSALRRYLPPRRMKIAAGWIFLMCGGAGLVHGMM